MFVSGCSSNEGAKYIGVQPYVVHEKQLKRAWKDIFFEALPEELGEKVTVHR